MTRAIRKAILSAGAVTMLSTALARAAEPPVEPQRNPFERPSVGALTTKVSDQSSSSSTTSSPYLRAVLFAGAKSVVDFGGVVLQVGESADGYRLVSVEEGQATFRRDHEDIVFSVYVEDSSED